jgi:Acetyltransferase (GNAT) family
MSAFALDDPRWQRHLVLGDGWRIFVRPLGPDDEGLIRDLLVHVSKEDLRLRFFDSIKEFSPQLIAGLTHIDYARAMAFVAIDEASNDIIGVVRLHSGKIHKTGEYAILLRSDLKGRGLGRELGFKVKTDAEDSGVCDVTLVLASNTQA